MSQKLGVLVIAACLLLYIGLLGQRAVALLATGSLIAVLMGIALLVLPAVGLWALVREIWFGFQASYLGKQMLAEGSLPEVDVTFTPSGRPTRTDAQPLLEQYAEAAKDPNDWRAQYRLGLVQDAAGARKDARASIRLAIRTEKSQRTKR